MTETMNNGIFIFAQVQEGHLLPVSFELIGKARDLAHVLETKVTALLLGSELTSLSDELFSFGADRVIAIDSPELKVYRTEPFTQAIAAVVEAEKPEILLVGATAVGRDLAPRLAARLHTGLTADCTKLEVEPETKAFQMTRPAFGGNLMATILCPKHRPMMATVRPGVMVKVIPDRNRKGELVRFDWVFKPSAADYEVLDVVKRVSQKKDIQDAKILVSGGRGMCAADGLSLLDELAGALGAEVSCSRAVVDSGYMEKTRQVGQTGKTVRPELYIACGISGAIQHLAGMEESKYIIAINKDPEAPIFKVADLGVVADAQKLLPKLADAIRQARA